MARAPSPLHLEDTDAGPNAGTEIARISELPNHGGKDILYTDGDFQTRIFVQKQGDTIEVFENSCPHAGTPLNMFGDRFLDMNGQHIICRTHGAVFDIASGKCLRGPCKGEFLRKIAIRIDGDSILSA